MKFVWGLVKILAEVLLLALLANYLYFAFWYDASAAMSGWALGLLLIAVAMCCLGFIGLWHIQRQHQKTPLDNYIEDVHKEEELLQKEVVAEKPKISADKFTPVLEKLVASSAKNTTTLNLAMENLNSRLDDLEAKFISRQTENAVPHRVVDEMPTAQTEYKPDFDEPDLDDSEVAPSGNYDEEFADIDKLEIMQDEQKNKDYEEVDIDTLLLRTEDAK